MRPVVAGLAQLLAVPLPDAADRVVERIPARLQAVRDVLGQHPQLHLRIEVVVLLARRTLLLVLQLHEHRPRRTLDSTAVRPTAR